MNTINGKNPTNGKIGSWEGFTEKKPEKPSASPVKPKAGQPQPPDGQKAAISTPQAQEGQEKDAQGPVVIADKHKTVSKRKKKKKRGKVNVGVALRKLKRAHNLFKKKGAQEAQKSAKTRAAGAVQSADGREDDEDTALRIDSENLDFNQDQRGKEAQQPISDEEKAQIAEGFAQAAALFGRAPKAQTVLEKAAASVFQAHFAAGNSPDQLTKSLGSAIKSLQTGAAPDAQETKYLMRNLTELAREFKLAAMSGDSQIRDVNRHMMSGIGRTMKLLSNNRASKQDLLPRLLYIRKHLKQSLGAPPNPPAFGKAASAA